ncbi:MAG: hypothetical protein MPN21_27325 [Thermoanaerobaculia bacterium]|nr:hypothetical protein [Thermoanaerobaculia bacterium]
MFAEAGFRAIDNQSDVTGRYYGGFRFAYNPEWYFDLLIGRTESLDSDRIELRGQLPIATTTKNSRIYLGLTANVGIDEPESSPEDDVIRIYAKWNVDLRGFFQNLAN